MTFIGKLIVQNVPVKPEWTIDDVSRVIFVEEENIVYVGGSVSYGDWIAIGQYFKDIGTGNDPETGADYSERSYKLSVENGNFKLTYS